MMYQEYQCRYELNSIAYQVHIFISQVMNAIKPRRYIKNSEKLENIQCKICYQVSEKPHYCLGPCGMVLCQTCTDQIKKNYGGCPQRCSKPLAVQPCPNIALQFVCPFNSVLCSQTFPSVELFRLHLQKCQHINAQMLNTVNNLNKYRCTKGHDLYFLTEEGLICIYGYFNFGQIQNSFCHSCQQKTLCRSICPQCSTKEDLVLFCCKCCRPPCTKTSCLHKHTLVKQQVYSFSNICDYCAKPTRLYGTHGYRDQGCNFDICEPCYELLPLEHERVPEQMQMSCIKHLSLIPMSDFDDYEEEELPLQQINLMDAMQQIQAHEQENVMQINLAAQDSSSSISDPPVQDGSSSSSSNFIQVDFDDLLPE